MRTPDGHEDHDDYDDHEGHVPAELAGGLQRRAEQVEGGAARAAVLGVNDGLVTNLCLILTIAGAAASRSSVRLAGFASLLAGAFSMAAGEWVSVRAQVDLYRGVLGRLRRTYVSNRPAVVHELLPRLQAIGLDLDTASTAASEIVADDRRGLDVAARVVVGINPDSLGSPWVAALSSLALFSVGAVVPLAPWFVTQGTAAVAWSIGLTALASAVVGALIGSMSEERLVRSAARQLAIVALAAGITLGIGKLLGTTVA
jgi:VIT1/CCC1 family predicted Fe2+/Mn2+ transporter